MVVFSKCLNRSLQQRAPSVSSRTTLQQIRFLPQNGLYATFGRAFSAGAGAAAATVADGSPNVNDPAARVHPAATVMPSATDINHAAIAYESGASSTAASGASENNARQPQCNKSRAGRSKSKSGISLDRFGRRHSYLRVSLTDTCNFRCKYCMPTEADVPCSPPEELLTPNEYGRLIEMFVHDVGVRKIRLTGGEPTLRSDFREILEILEKLPREIDGEKMTLGMTTNGLLVGRYFEELKRARVTNLNFSLDTLHEKKFPFISGRPGNWYKRVRDSIDKVIDDGEFKVKINVVVMRGCNEDEIVDFVEFTKDRIVYCITGRAYCSYPLRVFFL